MKPKTEWQGKIIIEPDDGGDLLVMFPDGEVVLGGDKINAEKVARRWLKKHANGNAINVGMIEWRRCG